MSTQEAIWHAVPMLGIPMFFDQYSVSRCDKINYKQKKNLLRNQNVHKAVDRGIAEVLYVNNLSIENLCEKILHMMMNPKYKEKIRIYSDAFRDQKETPLERAIWWIEWTMRHPVKNIFQSDGNSLHFFENESMDVIGFLTIVVALLICAIVLLVIKCCRCAFS